MSDDLQAIKDLNPASAAPSAEGEGLGEESAASEALRLKLDKFEGPFEVLLYLIRSQEIDIFDIPIVKVTEQYLGFLELMQEENLDIAGEFLVMAATLIQIKSKMILPIEVPDDEEEELEEEDPRLELVEKLLEYRKFRDLAKRLGDLGEYQANRYGRAIKPKIEKPEEEDYFEVSLYDLARALRSILRFITGQAIHEIAGEGSSVEEKIDVITTWLAERDSVTWTELFRECKTRMEIVCSLLAILELCRMGRIRAHQHRAFGDIRLFARPAEPEPYAGGGADAVVAA